MTHITRHLNAVIEKIGELSDKLLSFVNLIIMTLIEACFLFVFVKVHEQSHIYLDHLPWCPMKAAVTLMGFSFLLLNLVIVFAYVAKEIVTTLRSLRSSLSDDSIKAGTVPPFKHGGESGGQRLTISRSRIIVTTTVVKEADHPALSPVQLHSSKAEKLEVSGVVETYNRNELPMNSISPEHQSL